MEYYVRYSEKVLAWLHLYIAPYSNAQSDVLIANEQGPHGMSESQSYTFCYPLF